jgi:hypothetical protein
VHPLSAEGESALTADRLSPADRIRRWWRAAAEVRYTLALFVGTRAALTVIGVVSRLALRPILAQRVWEYSPYLWLSIWGVWDTGRYLDIADNGYSAVATGGRPQPNYAFFPLYPMVIRYVGRLLGDTFVAGLIVSNLSLLVGCIFLYRLIRLEVDEETGRRTLKYLFLFPGAFVLSGVFAESLFFAVTVAAFYYARRGHWALVGAFGFLAAATRQIGVLIVLPLAYEYLQALRRQRTRIRTDALCLLLIPLAPLAYGLYTYVLTGDPLALIHVRATWGEQLSNPLRVLIEAFFGGRLHLTFTAVFALSALVLLSVYARRIGFAYWLWGVTAILVPLATGFGALLGMPRYLVPVFPLHLILAVTAGTNQTADQSLSIALALLQGFLMAFWTNGALLMI